MRMLSMVLCFVVIVGALNWLVYALDGGQGFVKRLLGHKDETKMSYSEKVVYLLVGVSGVALLLLKVLALSQGNTMSYGMGCNYFDD